MTPLTPPPLFDRLLRAMLPARDRETVSGDLLEAYADRANRYGRSLATLWYARQLLSFAPHRFTVPERLLAGWCAFALLYGTWFGAMDLLLQHPGYLAREGIAATILGQALCTLLFLMLPGVMALRYVVAVGCLPVMYLIGLVVRGLLQGANLEGYVLLMALNLVIQATLTATVLVHRSRPSAPRLG